MRRAFPAVLAGVAGLACGNAAGQTLSWNNAAGGAASTAANWSPAQAPTSANDLLFNLGNSYTVTWPLAAAPSRTQSVRRGTVTFSFTSPHTVSNGITVGDTNALLGTLRVSGGTVTSGGPVTIGSVAGSSGSLSLTSSTAALLMSGSTSDMTVGSNGPGTLSLADGSLVEVADQLIAGNNSAGTATVTVSGTHPASPFPRSTVRVLGTGATSRLGQGGDATVNIQNGALMDFAGSLVIANGSASVSTVTIQGLGSPIPVTAKLDVAGDLLMGRNASAGAAAGSATLNVNSGGVALVGGTLFVAGDPDGGSAVLHLETGGSVSAGSLSINPGATLSLAGGSTTVDGGVLTNTNPSAVLSIGGADNPELAMANGASANLTTAVNGHILTVGGGAGVTSGTVLIDTGADLDGSGGDIIVGEQGGDLGTLIVDGAGSTLRLNPTADLVIGQLGIGSLEVRNGGRFNGSTLALAAVSPAAGHGLFTGAGTSVGLSSLSIGGRFGSSGGTSDVYLNSGATLIVSGVGTSTVIYPSSSLDITAAQMNVTGTVDSRGILRLHDAARLTCGGLIVSNHLRAHPDIPGATAVVLGPVSLTGNAIVTATHGGLELGDAARNDGFVSASGGQLQAIGQTITLRDADRALAGFVSMNDGTIVAPNGLEIVTGGGLVGQGTVTTPHLTFQGGGGSVTPLGTGMVFNGLIHCNQGALSGTKFILNGPAGGWTGSGAMSGQVVVNSGAVVTAEAAMQLGLSLPDGVVFASGSELHAGSSTVTLVDSDGVALPSVTDLGDGRVACLQPLTVPAGGVIFGHLASVETPLVTVNGNLAPGTGPGQGGRLTILGNLSLAPGSETTVDFGAPGLIGIDRVSVTGALTLNGRLHIPPPVGQVGSGLTTSVITAQSITGSFAEIEIPAGWRVWVTPTRVLASICPADFNMDGFVDFFDIDAWVACFEGDELACGALSPDFNHDGFLDFFDLDEFVAAFEEGC